jgi:beta-glucuronidase
VDTARDGDGAVLSVVADAGEGDVVLTLDGEPFSGALRVAGDGLWSPDSPRLHRLEATLYRGGVLADRYALRCGIRTVEVAGDQLLLNGAPIQLRGFGRHEDFPVLGRGTSPALAARDLHLMRRAGANSFRTAHYPCDEETLDIADQLGLMVIAETPAVALYFADEDRPRRQELTLASLAEMIARDRNRACVISWSVANEPRMSHPLAAAAMRELCDAARALDGSRPASYVTDLPDEPGPEVADIVFINGYPGWYRHPGQLDAAESVLAETLDRAHDRYRKPIVLTEFGADAIPGTHADPPAMWSEEYQAELIERFLRVAAERDFVTGTHIWAFADFATAQADHRPQSINFKGVFTRDRQPKLAAHRLRDLWQASEASPRARGASSQDPPINPVH